MSLFYFFLLPDLWTKETVCNVNKNIYKGGMFRNVDSSPPAFSPLLVPQGTWLIGQIDGNLS